LEYFRGKMKRPFLRGNPLRILLCFGFALPLVYGEAQITPGAPTKEYIRLADRLIAVEHSPQQGVLPGGLASTPINSACSLNGATFSSGQFSVTGTGLNGLGGTSDSFEFASVPVTGDVTIIGRIPSSPVGPLATNLAVGLMLRTDLTSSSPYALIGAGRQSGAQSLLATFRTRSTAGGLPASTYGSAFVPPYWFKLVRSGNTITGFTSGNGVDWAQLGLTLTSITAPTIYAGIAVANATANCTGATVLTAAVDQVVLSGTPDFYLTTSPVTVGSSAAGETNSYLIGVNPLYGFANSVSFTAAGLPSGVSWMFGPATVTPAGSTTLTVTAQPDTPPGSYPFTIHSSGAGKSHTAYATLTVAASSSGLGSGWRTASINNCSLNAATSANGLFTVTGGGGDLASTLDGFQFVYAPVTGDVTLIARIPSPFSGSALLGGGGAGLMLRKGLSVYDEYAFIGVGRPSASVALYQTVFRKRATAGQSPAAPAFGTTVFYSSFYGPYWFKLVRSGSTIAGYTSINGVDWTSLGTPLTGITANTVYMGLAVTSGNTTCATVNLTTAVFDSLSLVGGTGSGTPDFSIGVPSDVSNVNAGGSLSITTAVSASGGFTGAVDLSISELPDGAEGVFNPASVNGQSTSALLLTTSSSLTMPGSYSPTITGDSSVLSRSATTTFVVDPPLTEPPTVSASPSSGSGSAQVFSLIATEPTGASNVQWLQFLVNDTLSGMRACYLHYDVSTNELYLRDDSDPSWAASKQLGTAGAGTIANSQCSVDAAASSYSAGGTSATLTLALTFKPAFAGGKTLYGLADSGNWNSGWEDLGIWTVPVPSGSLPSAWTSWAIDNSCSLNTVAHNAGVFTLSGVGGGLGGTIDSFHFPSTAVTGNVTIVGRIPSSLSGYLNHLSGGGVGLMLRKGPTSASPYAFMGISRSGFGPVQMMYRGRATENTNASTPAWGPSFAAPYWFKLQRIGDTITGYSSADGTVWTSRGSTIIPAATTMYVGLAVIQGGGTVCSGTYTLTTTFDNVSITNP
jgi:hypothetical protein